MGILSMISGNFFKLSHEVSSLGGGAKGHMRALLGKCVRGRLPKIRA